LSSDDMKSSLITLDQMALKLGATTSVLRERSVRKDKIVAEVLVRKVFIFYLKLLFICVIYIKFIYNISCISLNKNNF